MDIRERVEVLKREEYALNKKLEKYILKIQKDFLKEENWFIHNKKEVNILINEKLIIDYSGKSHYISFLEKTINFSKTSTELEVNSIDEYNFNFKGKNLFKGNIIIFIIEYSKQGEKLRLNSYPLNTEKKLKFNEDTSYIRFAIRTEGTGTSIIESLEFEAEEKAEEELFYIPKKSKEPKKIKDFNVIFIGDEFTTRSFEPEFNTIKISPENWKEEIAGIDIDFFFCESAWQGNNGKWTNKIAKYNNQNQKELIELLKFCERNNIPSIFWNKEDPVHYERFIDTAKQFKYIFTTDANIVDKYKKEAMHNNVYPLQFAAQPLYNNPIMKYEKRLEKCCFAGTYFRNRYPERQKSTNFILSEGQKYGLDIFDRNYLLNREELKFPEEFDINVKGTLKYYEIDKAYKGYKVLLNVNSVTESPTMFSRRVFEALASNTPVISTYSKGIEKTFNDSIKVFREEKYLSLYFNNILNNKLEFEKLKLKGLREVLQSHTYKKRVEFLVSKLGIDFISNTSNVVTCISLCKSENEVKKVVNSFSYQSYENRKLKLFIKKFDGYENVINQYNSKNIDIYNFEFLDLIDNLLPISLSDKIAVISPNHYYGRNYLLDLVLACEYSESEIITKSNIEPNRDIMNKDYFYVNNGNIESSLITLELLKSCSIETFKGFLCNEFNLDYFSKRGYRILQIDGFNHLKNTYELTKKNYWMEV